MLTICFYWRPWRLFSKKYQYIFRNQKLIWPISQLKEFATSVLLHTLTMGKVHLPIGYLKLQVRDVIYNKQLWPLVLKEILHAGTFHLQSFSLCDSHTCNFISSCNGMCSGDWSMSDQPLGKYIHVQRKNIFMIMR